MGIRRLLIGLTALCLTVALALSAALGASARATRPSTLPSNPISALGQVLSRIPSPRVSAPFPFGSGQIGAAASQAPMPTTTQSSPTLPTVTPQGYSCFVGAAGSAQSACAYHPCRNFVAANACRGMSTPSITLRTLHPRRGPAPHMTPLLLPTPPFSLGSPTPGITRTLHAVPPIKLGP